MLLSDALNNRIDSEYRATANSLASFGFRGAFAFLAPLVGFGFDVWGMEVVLLALGFSAPRYFYLYFVRLCIWCQMAGYFVNNKKIWIR